MGEREMAVNILHVAEKAWIVAICERFSRKGLSALATMADIWSIAEFRLGQKYLRDAEIIAKLPLPHRFSRIDGNAAS
jgi:hypothetical protein